MAKKITAVLALLAAAVLSPYFYYRHIPLSRNEAQAASSGTAAEPDANPSSTLPTINKPGKGKIWVCPMHPEIMQDHPGTCPICGMKLVESDYHEAHEHGVHVDSATVQILGVRLARVRRASMAAEVRTYGTVTADGSALYSIHSFFDGVIKKSYIHSVGQKIRKGQVIYEIYSPELNMQQQDYLKFVSRRNQILQTISGDSLIYENEYVMDLLEELSRERTKFLYEDVGIETVQQLEDHRRVVETVPILAAESGVVTQVNMREGDNVMPAATLFTLADISRIWVEAALYPDQLGKVRAGDEATVKVDGGRPVKTKVAFVSPVAENNKVTARVVLDNGDGQLRPGVYAEVLIHYNAHEALVLPRSAVIFTGDGSVVMLSRGNGHFLPVHVETGIENGDNVEIVDGLREGAEVAANGQFLLDAASSMNAAAERMHSGHHD